VKPSMAADELVIVSYSQLLGSSGEILAQLERAFGPSGLGVIAVSEVSDSWNIHAQT